MKLSKQRSEGHMEELLHELRAINLWDRAFFCADKPDLIEFSAWENRRRRVFEIYQALFTHLNQGRGSVFLDGPQAHGGDEDG